MSESKTPVLDRLHKELTEKREALKAELKPYRDFYEKHINDNKYVEAVKKIREISKKLMPIENELAGIVRRDPKNVGSLKAESGEYKSE